MTRARSGIVSKRRHKKIINLAKGYRGRSKNCFRIAIQKVEKALSYSYRDRRTKKRDLRQLWIQRINAAARQQGLKYSVLMHKLKLANICINRKILADLSVLHPNEFNKIIDDIS
ncbi:50S ribosomal protein L20 [Rickettsia endosymbiont of Cardiosporidium cionae]|uniref:50S ribosomal protein L20 n=1 Tax=Rickettsia endosymbiont of Cardiosporidium cionae TaxID=2777155 RepID=UPI0018951C41|nr:50S ribosomal protein L20 [Rickettsia endosymbiont of Cardiosporidium cionae]KAF8818549.1 50S ribosomal protein L20 [Rickettsia endosymbiont of Cardiosporidium cionae]